MAPTEPEAFEYIVIGGGSGGSGTVSWSSLSWLWWKIEGRERGKGGKADEWRDARLGERRAGMGRRL